MRVMRGIVGVLLSGLLLSSCATMGAKDKETGASRAAKQADTLVASGQLAEALALYEQALTDPALPPARRNDVLYSTAVIRLAPEPSVRDLSKARAILSDLQASAPQHPRHLEIEAALSLLGEISARESQMQTALDAKNGEMAAMRTELEARAVRAEKVVEAAQAEAGDRSRLARDEMEMLRRDLAAVRRELETTRAELQKKDDALKRLAQRMIKPGE